MPGIQSSTSVLGEFFLAVQKTFKKPCIAKTRFLACFISEPARGFEFRRERERKIVVGKVTGSHGVAVDGAVGNIILPTCCASASFQLCDGRFGSFAITLTFKPLRRLVGDGSRMLKNALLLPEISNQTLRSLSSSLAAVALVDYLDLGALHLGQKIAGRLRRNGW